MYSSSTGCLCCWVSYEPSVTIVYPQLTNYFHQPQFLVIWHMTFILAGLNLTDGFGDFGEGKFLDLLLKQPVIAIILQLSFHLPLKRDIFLTNQFLRVFWSFVLGLWFNRLEEHLLLLRVNNSNNQSSCLKIGYFWLYCLLQHWSLHSLLSL